MLKHLLIKTAEIINRNDIISCLKTTNSIDEISDSSLQNEICKLINFYNFTVSSIYENYLDLTFTEKVKSDSEKKIHYYKFSHEPIKILYLSDESKKYIPFLISTNHFIAPSANQTYDVTYKTIPCEVNDLSDETNLPKSINTKILCFAIASEYLASKGLFDESSYWKNKFMFELFKLKTKKEKRLKPTFILWQVMNHQF